MNDTPMGTYEKALRLLTLIAKSIRCGGFILYSIDDADGKRTVTRNSSFATYDQAVELATAIRADLLALEADIATIKAKEIANGTC